MTRVKDLEWASRGLLKDKYYLSIFMVRVLSDEAASSAEIISIEWDEEKY
jgi:hypothetical protein